MFSIRRIINISFIVLFSYFVYLFQLNYEIPEFKYCKDDQFIFDGSIKYKHSVLYNENIIIYRGLSSMYSFSKLNGQNKEILIKNFPKDTSLNFDGFDILHPDFLFAIKHSYQNGGERIESFRINIINEEIILEYLHTTQIGSSLNKRFSDLVFLSKDRFLISQTENNLPFIEGNDLHIAQNIIITIAQIFQIKKQSVWDCKYIKNGYSQCEEVPNSNGIFISGMASDKKGTIAVADRFGRVVNIYKLDQSQKLQFIQNVSVNQMIEHIYYDAKRSNFIVGSKFSFAVYKSYTKDKNSYEQKIMANNLNREYYDTYDIIERVLYNDSSKKYECVCIFSIKNYRHGLEQDQKDN